MTRLFISCASLILSDMECIILPKMDNGLKMLSCQAIA